MAFPGMKSADIFHLLGVLLDWVNKTGGFIETSLVAQTVKRLSTMQETWVQTLVREDLLEKEMVTHSSILAWKVPWTEEPGGLQYMGGRKESDMTE